MTIRIPAEWEPHACCWMAWAVHKEWGKAVNRVKRELSEIVEAIARYEPVRLLAPRSHTLREARREFSDCPSVSVIEAPVDDIWMRDIAPTLAVRGGVDAQEIVAVDWNFNSWGETKGRPRRPGDQLAKTAASIFDVPRISVEFIAEGGALVTDGQGTLITTRSCLLNPNRNKICNTENRETAIERELDKLGIRRVIWLEGDPYEPITSGHIDGYVLFSAPGAVLVASYDKEDRDSSCWRKHDIATLEDAEDAGGRRLKVARVRSPRKRYWRYCGELWSPCYLNAYVANGAVITACFGDHERDEAAKCALTMAFPDREIIMLRIDHIANGGGGIRCLTQPMGIARTA